MISVFIVIVAVLILFLMIKLFKKFFVKRKITLLTITTLLFILSFVGSISIGIYYIHYYLGDDLFLQKTYFILFYISIFILVIIIIQVVIKKLKK